MNQPIGYLLPILVGYFKLSRGKIVHNQQAYAIVYTRKQEQHTTRATCGCLTTTTITHHSFTHTHHVQPSDQLSRNKTLSSIGIEKPRNHTKGLSFESIVGVVCVHGWPVHKYTRPPKQLAGSREITWLDSSQY